MKRYKSCSRCGKIHPVGQECSRFYYKRDDDAFNIRQTSRWHRKSLEIRENAQWLCEVCRTQGRYEHEGLEVHHIRPLKEYPDGAVDNLNLVCLCGRCHEQAERGEISEELLLKLAEERENLSPRS